MEYIKQIAPRCKECRHPEEDDPKRMMILTQDEYNGGRDVVLIECPTIRCGAGWFKEVIFEKIEFHKP